MISFKAHIFWETAEVILLRLFYCICSLVIVEWHFFTTRVESTDQGKRTWAGMLSSC